MTEEVKILREGLVSIRDGNTLDGTSNFAIKVLRQADAAGSLERGERNTPKRKAEDETVIWVSLGVIISTIVILWLISG